ncbi:hypothetical protein U1Q18_047206 [Sarracenia purpurea var. burkii]
MDCTVCFNVSDEKGLLGSVSYDNTVNYANVRKAVRRQLSQLSVVNMSREVTEEEIREVMWSLPFVVWRCPKLRCNFQRCIASFCFSSACLCGLLLRSYLAPSGWWLCFCSSALAAVPEVPCFLRACPLALRNGSR